MRLDRLISIRVAKPLMSMAAASRSEATLPILMYHSISDDPEQGASDYYKVCTSPKRFRDHMACLARKGYRGVSLKEGLEELASDNHSDKKPVAITFDDGFSDFYTEAYPILNAHDFTATMYLPTAYIGTEARIFKGKRCLTWAQVKELDEANMEFGSHTVTHPKLVELEWSGIESELLDSKQAIEDQLGKPVASFAYPYAFPQQSPSFVNRLIELLRQSGYKNCATTRIGRVKRQDNPYQLKRLPANSADDDALLEAKLAGSYDWLAKLQNIKKALAKN